MKDTDSKWCESWEKNFDSTFKALNKFKDDLKQKPVSLNSTTRKRCHLYIELLKVELQGIEESFGGPEDTHFVSSIES